MNVHLDLAAAKCPHGVAEEIPAGRLHDVLGELWTIGLKSLPLFCGADPFIGDTVAAEFVLTDTWFHIGEPPAGGKLDKEHPRSIGEGESLDPFCGVHRDRPHSGSVDVPPELHNMRIGLSPRSDQRLQLLLRHTGFQCTHCLERTD